jgi:hypothetical protein
MALVIFCVALVEAMRLRRSFRLAIALNSYGLELRSRLFCARPSQGKITGTGAMPAHAKVLA